MKKNILFAVSFLPLFSFELVRAAGIDVTLPGAPAPTAGNPGGWVLALYQFSLMAAGLLAFGMIVYAGLRYTFAAGNPSTQSDARDQILQALLGLLLLFGAFIVLTTINPNLTNLGLPGLKKIEPPTPQNQQLNITSKEELQKQGPVSPVQKEEIQSTVKNPDAVGIIKNENNLPPAEFQQNALSSCLAGGGDRITQSFGVGGYTCYKCPNGRASNQKSLIGFACNP